jgi:hypothetical protein
MSDDYARRIKYRHLSAVADEWQADIRDPFTLMFVAAEYWRRRALAAESGTPQDSIESK